MQIQVCLEQRYPFAAATSFGTVGPYEILTGHLLCAVDPAALAYRAVVDLEHAPCNASGLVEYTTAFAILKPVEPRRGNRRLLYDVINRGNKRALQFFNDAPPSNRPFSLEHAGNGFLMRRGYTLVWSAWQGDLLPGDNRLTMDLPVAVTETGPLTGVVRTEFIAEAPALFSVPLSGNDYTRSYPSASLETRTATFTCRGQADDERQSIPPEAWQFARREADGQITPSVTDCYLPEGFRPGWIYELIYQATSPLVLGLGFVSVRDFISFLRYSECDAVGTPNPLHERGTSIDKAYAWGRSQSGRFLREFVYRGWNQDLAGRRVFDGIFPHVAGAGRVALNYRFAQPGRYPRQHEDALYPSDQFPFAYAPATDPWSGRTDALLKRPAVDPLVIHTQTASEYWQRRGSLVHTDAFGLDLADHPQARIYLFASSQHFAPPHSTPETGIHRYPSNPLNTTPLLRALLEALDRWATIDTPPPASRMPRRADGTLVPAAAVQAAFPSIPGLECPGIPNRLYVQDYGPQVGKGLFTREPPVVDRRQEYAVLVSAVDPDGNEIAGIRTPDLEVPLATYTGWNLRATGYGAPALASIIGSYLPLATTAAQRQERGDPRPSLAERYRSRADYVRRLARAVQQLVDACLLLEEDADRYVAAVLSDNALTGLGD